MQFWMSSDAIVEDLQLYNSANVHMSPVFCQRMRFRRLYAYSDFAGPHHKNTDGFNPSSSSDISLEDSYIHNGDDCVAIKSGKQPSAWSCDIPSQNILIKNVTCAGSHGLTIGSEVAGGIRNISFLDVRIHGADGHPSSGAIKFKLPCGRGAYVADVLYENVTASDVASGIMLAGAASSCSLNGSTVVNNVTIRNVLVQKIAGPAFAIDGYSVEGRPANYTPFIVHLDNVTMVDYAQLGSCSHATVQASDVSPLVPTKDASCMVSGSSQATTTVAVGPIRTSDDDNGPTIFAPFNMNGRSDWPANFTNVMWDLHYQPFGYYGNDTSQGAADWYNATFSSATAFTVLKGGRNLLRADVVFWGWYSGGHHLLAEQWQERWKIVHAYIQPWVAKGVLSGVYFGDELMGQGLPLSNLTAAVKLVRATWPSAVLAYNEDVCTMMTGFNQQAERVSVDPNWRLPSELDYFSVDYYCSFHACPHHTSPSPFPVNSSFDPHCAANLRRVHERLIYPRLGARTKVTPVAGAWAPYAGARSPPCPAWLAGPQCPNPLNASLDVYDAFWARHASQLWEWAQNDRRVGGFSPWHFDDEPSYPPQMQTGFRNLPQTLSVWVEIGTRIMENARRAAEP